MNLAERSPIHAAAWRAWPVVCALAGITGCASLGSPVALDAASSTPQLQACVDDYAALDAAVDAAGVRDAGATRIPGFAYLRADRFTASLQDKLSAPVYAAPNTVQKINADAGQAMNQAATYAALLQRMVQLDLDARRFEIANLPVGSPIWTRAQWASNADGSSNAATLLQRLQNCANLLVAHDAASPQRTAALLPRLQVPDSYRTAYRAAGVYAITRYPFAAGVRKLEAERSSVMNNTTTTSSAPPIEGVRRLRYAPAPVTNAPAASASAPAPATLFNAAQLRTLLNPPLGDPLHIPAPSPADQAQLLAQFAPHFEIDIASDNDKPGALQWTADELSLDTTTPTLYQHVAHTRYGAHNLLQLVYTVWFAARPPALGSALDLLAGKLDGITWRVTLAPDGTPLVYDTMHPCGCYHMFFTSPSAQPKPAPQQGIDWAFVPHSLPPLGAGQRVVVRIAPTTHYIDRLGIETVGAQAAIPMTVRDYNGLRALPLDGSAMNTLPSVLPVNLAVNFVSNRTATSRSMFNPQGFVDGTDRAERYLFWPMGIARAGSMRQWGQHATAFVGRRHFDDATLMQQRFEFDAKHFDAQRFDAQHFNTQHFGKPAP